MQHVITADEAKKITKGRTPLVPVEYETACKALEACRTLDEAKYWDNKADALAAWAKIYRNDDAGRKARALKLWAYRRMGELAGEIAGRRRMLPGGVQANGAFAFAGTTPGPLSVLKNSGLTQSQSQAARRLAAMKEQEVRKFAELQKPPTPVAMRMLITGTGANNKYAFSRKEGWIKLWRGVNVFMATVRENDARAYARSVEPESAAKVRERITVIIDWLDEFERHLPKEKRK